MSKNTEESLEVGFSRRDLLRGASILGVSALVATATSGCDSSTNEFVATSTNGPAAPPLPPGPPVGFVQPQVLRSSDGFLSVPMDIDLAVNQVPTPNGLRNFLSRTINGTISPPTIRIKPGDKLELPINNKLLPNPDQKPPDENTPHHFNSFNMHTHGFHVSPSQDDVITTMPPQTEKTYTYDIPSDHPSGNFWYHPHKHGATAVHLFSGMSGTIIIEGGLDEVPEIAAAADLVFNIQELQLGGAIDPTKVTAANPLGQSNPNLAFGKEAANATIPKSDPYIVPPYTATGAFGGKNSLILVNGEYQPEIKVRPGQVVRLRILNSTVRQTMPLSLSGGNSWSLLSLDGLALPSVKTVSQFTLAPANRAEVCFKVDTPGTYNITREPFTANIDPGAAGPSQPFVLATVTVAGEPFPQSLPTGALPVSPTLPDILPAEINAAPITLTFAQAETGGPEIPQGSGTFAANFTLDGNRFDPSRVDQSIALNSVIEWTLVNMSTQYHPHHIHINPFQVIATSDGFINGDPNMRLDELGPTWLDTVHVPPMTAAGPGTVTLRQRYPDFRGTFVLHCHILVHEDIGMMQLVEVV